MAWYYSNRRGAAVQFNIRPRTPRLRRTVARITPPKDQIRGSRDVDITTAIGDALLRRELNAHYDLDFEPIVTSYIVGIGLYRTYA